MVKRMALAMVWRWMKRALASSPSVSGQALQRGDLDEIAEHVVVLDLQRLDAGLFGILQLQAGDDPARLVAQRPHLVEFRMGAFAQEAAIALQQRQFVRQHGPRAVDQLLRQGVHGRRVLAQAPRTVCRAPAGAATSRCRLQAGQDSCRDRAGRRARAPAATARAACPGRASGRRAGRRRSDG